jgi:hypothetical protein
MARKFVIVLDKFGKEVQCEVSSPNVAEAYMDLLLQGKTKKAMELLWNEVVKNKEEIEPLLGKYPLLKATILAKIAEALGGVVEAEIREIENTVKN